ncbi:hypothetical protein [Pseudomonas sp. SLFW]|uniref:hypothetical protein n=1 Tax=Pseudomonas sp. SLFW TaxID=2683259 RepID=UPI0014133BE8|nr:hypothetical protein [Pseudomonas sp. SLFW]
MSAPEKLKTVKSTPFSDFVRNASSEEKERVYQEVMKKAWERQERIIEKARNL